MEEQSRNGHHQQNFIIIDSNQAPYIGVKIVTSFPHNTQVAMPSINASYMLSDSFTGRPLAFIDGTEITHWRTSCISALAASYLARQEPHVLVMVGAGQLAPYLIRAHLYVRPTFKKVIIWNRSPSKAQALVENLSGRLGSGVEIERGVDLDEIVGQADVISCATCSELPLVHGGVLKPGTHLDLVGSFSPSMKECDDEALARARIFVDCEVALKEAGELVGAFGRGVILPQDVVGTLAELARGEKGGRSGIEEITVFKSVGSAAVDLVTAQLIYEKHVQCTSD
ncbi:hypothetical protein SUGI_0039740 [Cryptomeria japonica]|nr:hypothetical protein SUGI_0039740 [Cryptomeria japonica]